MNPPHVSVGIVQDQPTKKGAMIQESPTRECGGWFKSGLCSFYNLSGQCINLKSVD